MSPIGLDSRDALASWGLRHYRIVTTFEARKAGGVPGGAGAKSWRFRAVGVVVRRWSELSTGRRGTSARVQPNPTTEGFAAPRCVYTYCGGVFTRLVVTSTP